ncbi:MAG: hypothetical protein MHM6MM_002383 [Cercozoa sp. M6MM]
MEGSPTLRRERRDRHQSLDEESTAQSDCTSSVQCEELPGESETWLRQLKLDPDFKPSLRTACTEQRWKSKNLQDLRVDIGSTCTRGSRRSFNQDRVAIQSAETALDTVVCGVFDGHGSLGENAAELAANLIPHAALSFLANFDGTDETPVLVRADTSVTASTTDDGEAEFESPLVSSGYCESNPATRQSVLPNEPRSVQVSGRDSTLRSSATGIKDDVPRPDVSGPSRALYMALAQAHEVMVRICDAQHAYNNKDNFDYGTTACVALLQGRTLTVATCGDSRAIMFRVPKAEFLFEKKPWDTAPSEAERARARQKLADLRAYVDDLTAELDRLNELELLLNVDEPTVEQTARIAELRGRRVALGKRSRVLYEDTITDGSTDWSVDHKNRRVGRTHGDTHAKDDTEQLSEEQPNDTATEMRCDAREEVIISGSLSLPLGLEHDPYRDKEERARIRALPSGRLVKTSNNELRVIPAQMSQKQARAASLSLNMTRALGHRVLGKCGVSWKPRLAKHDLTGAFGGKNTPSDKHKARVATPQKVTRTTQRRQFLLRELARANAKFDIFVVLASDGLWDVVSEKETIVVLANSADVSVASRKLTALADHLWRANTPRGDNIATIVVKLEATWLDGALKNE